MGAWGHRTFENDSAMDWVGELVESDEPSMVVETLEAVLIENGDEEEEYLDIDAASAALAAAEVVAALRGRPGADLPDEVKKWIKDHGAGLKVDQELIDTTHDAIARIAADSELQEQWMESDSAKDWAGVVEDLQKRVGR